MFVKLFSEILDSSVWKHGHSTVRVWITMLAMAGPDGVVRASADGVAARARVSRRGTDSALALLMEPDADSRGPENGGKQIERVDGGYLILDYPKYRALRQTEERRLQVLAANRRWRESRGKPVKKQPPVDHNGHMAMVARQFLSRDHCDQQSSGDHTENYAPHQPEVQRAQGLTATGRQGGNCGEPGEQHAVGDHCDQRGLSDQRDHGDHAGSVGDHCDQRTPDNHAGYDHLDQPEVQQTQTLTAATATGGRNCGNGKSCERHAIGGHGDHVDHSDHMAMVATQFLPCDQCDQQAPGDHAENSPLYQPEVQRQQGLTAAAITGRRSCGNGKSCQQPPLGDQYDLAASIGEPGEAHLREVSKQGEETIKYTKEKVIKYTKEKVIKCPKKETIQYSQYSLSGYSLSEFSLSSEFGFERAKRAPAFDEFYSAYPRKAGRGNAERAWTALTADQKRDAVSAVLLFAQAWGPVPKGARNFCPFPATWLRGKRWCDDPAEWALQAGKALPSGSGQPGEQGRLAMSASTPAERAREYARWILAKEKAEADGLPVPSDKPKWDFPQDVYERARYRLKRELADKAGEVKS